MMDVDLSVGLDVCVKNPFWVFYGPRDLSQIAASPPLLQPDSRNGGHHHE
jgi:hypothetical protein